MWGEWLTTSVTSQGPEEEQQVSLVRLVVTEAQHVPNLKLLIKAKSP